MSNAQTTITKILIWAVSLQIVACTSDSDDGAASDNPDFDLWCGDELCAWEINAGDVERVATWHPKDYGAELREENTTISQIVDGMEILFDWESVDCVLFDILAEQKEGVELYVAIDLLADDWKNPEYKKRVELENWKPSFVELPLTRKPTGPFRVMIQKQGAAPLLLARVQISYDWNCSALETENAIKTSNIRPRQSERGGEPYLTVLRERNGTVVENPTRFQSGDRFQLLLTHPGPEAVTWDVAVFQQEEAYFPYDSPVPLAAGNRVPLPGAFRLTGQDVSVICVLLENNLAPREQIERNGLDVLETGLCTTLVPVFPGPDRPVNTLGLN